VNRHLPLALRIFELAERPIELLAGCARDAGADRFLGIEPEVQGTVSKRLPFGVPTAAAATGSRRRPLALQACARPR
jgi:hypothetical protein